jgi:hypothetical protein
VAGQSKRRVNGGLKGRWRRAVLHSHALRPAEKLVCLALAEHMSDAGRVRVTRQRIADDLGWETKQRVTDRIAAIEAAGYLSKLDGGANGLPVRYDAMIPTADRVWLASVPDPEPAAAEVRPLPRRDAR